LDISKIKEKIIDELSTMKKNMTNLMSAAVELSISPKLDENLILTGQGKLLDTVDLSQNVKSIKKIIELFEKKTALLQLLEKSHHHLVCKYLLEKNLDTKHLTNVVSSQRHTNPMERS